MMSDPIDVRERLGLCDLLLELGPEAPTLCAGWTTADLAAHLVLREHFRRWSDAQRAEEKAQGFPALVARLRAGAPLISDSRTMGPVVGAPTPGVVGDCARSPVTLASSTTIDPSNPLIMVRSLPASSGGRRAVHWVQVT